MILTLFEENKTLKHKNTSFNGILKLEVLHFSSVVRIKIFIDFYSMFI